MGQTDGRTGWVQRSPYGLWRSANGASPLRGRYWRYKR